MIRKLIKDALLWFTIESAFVVVLLIALGAGAAYLGARLFGPATHEQPPLDRESRHVSVQAADAIGGLAGNAWTGAYVYVAPFVGDAGGEVRDHLAVAVQGATRCYLAAPSVGSEVRQGVMESLAKVGLVSRRRADSWKGQAPQTLEQALLAGKQSEADYVVYGRLLPQASNLVDNQLGLDLRVADVRAESLVLQARLDKLKLPEALFLGSEEGGRPVVAAVVCLFAMLLIPLLTAPLWSSILKRQSPYLNAMVIVALTLLGAAVAWGAPVLVGGKFTPAIAVLFAAFVSAAWNLLVLSVAERQRQSKLLAP